MLVFSAAQCSTDLTHFHPGSSKAKGIVLGCGHTQFLWLKWWKVILGLLSPGSFSTHRCCWFQNTRLSFEPLSKAFPYNFSWNLLRVGRLQGKTIFSSLGEPFHLTEPAPKEHLQSRIAAAFPPFLWGSRTSDQFAPWGDSTAFMRNCAIAVVHKVGNSLS